MSASRILALLVTLVSLSCGTAGDPERSAAPVDTVVLVTIDTWRRDATGFLGERDPSPTPFLDRLASEGFVATDAVAPVPLTGPSHWSMLTGRWPWRDGLRTNGSRPEAGQAETMARILKGRGWSTGAFVSCSVLDSRFGFSDGFDHYDDRFAAAARSADLEMPERRGDRTVEAAIAWLAAQEPGRPVFLWVHLFDPHFPYVSPEGAWKTEHGGYLAEVAFADAQVARLAAALEASERSRDRSLWVVLSDHGEGLGEHDELTHGFLLHGATMRIPFLVSGPGIDAEREEGLVSTVDVFPTVMGYLGIRADAQDGIDLLKEAPPPDRAVPLESMLGADSFGLSPVVGLRLVAWLWESSPEEHIWDLDTDPAELDDLASTRPDQVKRLRGLQRGFGVPEFRGRERPDRETLEALHSLGYVSSGAVPGEEDVRAFVREGARWYFDALGFQKEGRFEEAERNIRRFLERYPPSQSVLIEGGFVAVGLNDYSLAEHRFESAIGLGALDTKARLNLGNVLLTTGRLEEAESEYRQVLDEDPEDLFALYNLGHVLMRRGDPKQAEPYWRRFIELYPDHPRADSVRAQLADRARP